MSEIPDEVFDLAQRAIAAFPLVVVGSGSSVPYGMPGMPALAEHLKGEIKPDGNDELNAWTFVRTCLSNGDGLERALSKNVLPDSLTFKIIRSTWNMISGSDSAALSLLLSRPRRTGLARLLGKLSTSSNKEINIVTTNYDRIIEYISGIEGIYCDTGFLPGSIQKQNDGPHRLLIEKYEKSVLRLHKVHGSLDWFARNDGGIFSISAKFNLGEEFRPLIVTPGVEKYRQVYQDPFRRVLSNADSALDRAASYICLGYGFRDEHIEPRMRTRCRDRDAPILVLTKELTPEALSFLNECGGKNYLAFENCGENTRVRTRSQPDGIECPGTFWTMEGFVERFL
ncbi:SIR2 family protein [Marinicauda pacifica]|uniref:SIR2 family protein n=1 Tax=Marinicauda pacifica TaxID=1133559 RepID=UPI0035C83297